MGNKSLWRAGFSLFRQNWRAWGELSLLFTIILAPGEFWILKVSGPYNATIFDALHHGHMADVKNTPQPRNGYLSAGLGFLYYVATYCFYGLYLRQAPVVKATLLNVKGFLYVSGNLILKCLAVLGWMIMVLIPLFIVGAIIICILALLKLTVMMFVVASVMCIVGLLAEMYFFARYMLVYPMAMERVQSSLKVSEQLTRDKIWRIVGNYIITFLLTAPLMSVSIAAISGWRYWTSDVTTGLLAIAIVFCTLVVTGVFSAFVCSTARILYNEKMQSEPSFQLKFKSN